jgi:peroxiredoxin
MIAFKTLLKRMKKNIWVPPGVPPEAVENFDVEIIPKEIEDEIESRCEQFGPLQQRPVLHEFEMKLIEYSEETKEYSINTVNSSKYFDENIVIAIGIIGAFVPECTREVVYDWAVASGAYESRFDINKVVIVSRNDPYVMLKFAQKLNYEGRLSFLADWDGTFNKYIEMDVEHKLELGVRNHRYMAFLLGNSLRVVHKSYYSHLFYSKCIHPIFLWQRLMFKKKIPIYFN